MIYKILNGWRISFFFNLTTFIVQQLGLYYILCDYNKFILLLCVFDIYIFIHFCFNNSQSFAAVKGGTCWLLYVYSISLKVIFMYFFAFNDSVFSEDTKKDYYNKCIIFMLLSLSTLIYTALSVKSYKQLYPEEISISNEKIFHNNLILHVVIDLFDIFELLFTLVKLSYIIKNTNFWVKIIGGVLISFSLYLNAYSFPIISIVTEKNRKNLDLGDIYFCKKHAAVIGIILVDIPFMILRFYFLAFYFSNTHFQPLLIKNICFIPIKCINIKHCNIIFEKLRRDIDHSDDAYRGGTRNSIENGDTTGGRDGGGDGGRDGGRGGSRDGGRDGGRDGSRDGDRDGSRDGGKNGTKKGDGYSPIDSNNHMRSSNRHDKGGNDTPLARKNSILSLKGGVNNSIDVKSNSSVRNEAGDAGDAGGAGDTGEETDGGGNKKITYLKDPQLERESGEENERENGPENGPEKGREEGRENGMGKTSEEKVRKRKEKKENHHNNAITSLKKYFEVLVENKIANLRRINTNKNKVGKKYIMNKLMYTNVSNNERYHCYLDDSLKVSHLNQLRLMIPYITYCLGKIAMSIVIYFFYTKIDIHDIKLILTQSHTYFKLFTQNNIIFIVSFSIILGNTILSFFSSIFLSSHIEVFFFVFFIFVKCISDFLFLLLLVHNNVFEIFLKNLSQSYNYAPYFYLIFSVMPSFKIIRNIYIFLCSLSGRQFIGYIIRPLMTEQKKRKLPNFLNIKEYQNNISSRNTSYINDEFYLFNDKELNTKNYFKGDYKGFISIASLLIYINTKHMHGLCSLSTLMIGNNFIKNLRLNYNIRNNHLFLIIVNFFIRFSLLLFIYVHHKANSNSYRYVQYFYYGVGGIFFLDILLKCSYMVISHNLRLCSSYNLQIKSIYEDIYYNYKSRKLSSSKHYMDDLYQKYQMNHFYNSTIPLFSELA
ncbi:conserved Plasmodium protein, unknown function [Plasmodium ovale]|uniref:TMEM121 domain-containing protein n=1 Tax=Plasmodium ovale TaxID=36330 RepID=A0A1C3KNM6_PLAOA|nr:conserved Plasmodium protein, unknown function [Plasmodium ovale]